MTSPEYDIRSASTKCPECGKEMYYSEAFLCYVCTNDNCIKSIRFINEEEVRKAYNKHLQGKNEPQQFQPGDVVRLKSGGPNMTISLVINEYVECIWHDNTGHLQRIKCYKSVLEKPGVKKPHEKIIVDFWPE